MNNDSIILRSVEQDILAASGQQEKWFDIVSLEGFYIISNCKRIKRLKRSSVRKGTGVFFVLKEKILSPKNHKKNGFVLTKNGKGRRFRIGNIMKAVDEMLNYKVEWKSFTPSVNKAD